MTHFPVSAALHWSAFHPRHFRWLLAQLLIFPLLLRVFLRASAAPRQKAALKLHRTPSHHSNIKYFFLHQSHYLSITYKPPPTRANAPPAARYAILNIEGRSLPRFSLLEKTTKRA